jgi:hypothetical protein
MLKILPITDGEGNELGSEWEREDVSDSSVVFRSYIPCDKNFVKRLNINYALRSGVTDNPFAKAGEGSSSSEGGAGAYGAAKQILLDVSEPGRKVANITLRSTATGRPEFKQYVFEVEKYYGLFDVVNEHLGSIRVVDNNPAINKSGLEFSWCMWEQKEGDSWVKVGGNQLYYTAGMSIHDKFSSTDSMRVTLRTASGDYLKTCPDVSHSSDKGSATGEPLVEVYPNPVALGGIIKIKQNNPSGGNNGEAEIELLYATFYIFDTQGHLIRFGNVSSLNEGLTAPEAPGIYHLILEGKAGKKAIEIAVVRE